MTTITKITYIYLAIAPLFSGCRKFVEVDPPYTNTSREQVFNTDGNATAALTGIYMQLSKENLENGAMRIISLYAGLSADELVVTPRGVNEVVNQYATNQLQPSIDQFTWRGMYNRIFEVNAALEGLEKSATLTPEVKAQLTGEAKFFRAFSYFYLTNLYGEIPLALTTDYSVNRALIKASQDKVYAQIINDLLDAEQLLSADYKAADALSTTTERVRPCKGAASALLARVYLYTKDYSNAILYSSKLIDNSAVYDTVPLSDVFLANNKEAIWQIPSVNGLNQTNTSEGRIFIVSPTTNQIGGPSQQISNWLLDAFEPGDLRKTNWIAAGKSNADIEYIFPFKYKIGFEYVPQVEYSTILRLAEQYLIRGEARANAGDPDGATADINVVRKRAGLTAITANDLPGLMEAVIQERRVELFTEWGHRWLDLKRLNLTTEVLSLIKPDWRATSVLYPIPQSDLDRAPQLKQNEGYN
ncbi:MAG: RagB/SusD family nutrient uptake outer membrane protein [Chitinophagaceae bacterium]|nr:RagB/SusD family nutrient uptake outer membrane protein [Chitinophagaceae bacterium]